MAVRIRMKKLVRRHRAFFRVCAMDKRSPRDGRALEELGTYDPMIGDTDARAVLNGERIDYWLGVGAQPSEKVKALIKKYGTNGTRLDEQKVALATLAESRRRPELPMAKPAETSTEESTEAEAPAAEAPAAEAPATEAPAEPVEEAPAEEKSE